MDRRTVLKAMAAAIPVFALPETLYAQSKAPRLKITDIKVFQIKVVREIGMFESAFHTPTSPTPVRVGGGSIMEIYTDQGVTGFGPGVAPADLALVKSRLVGKDPLDVGLHARFLQLLGKPGYNAEIALWDLIGKACNQPLVKLWGGGLDKLMPYGATLGIEGGPEGRARAALQIKAAGFKGAKMRSSFPTMKEDIEMMEKVRKAVGDDYILLTDANKAGPYGNTQLTDLWDFQRAVTTAKAYEDLGLYWLEEPLDKNDYEGLKKLRAAVPKLRLAGGELQDTLYEYRQYLENDSYDILNCDVSNCGVTMWKQVADMALAHNKYIVPHASGMLGVATHIHLAASQPQPAYGTMDRRPHIEIQENPPYQNFKEIWSIFTNPPLLDKDGYIPVPTDPGLGLTIQPDLIIRT